MKCWRLDLRRRLSGYVNGEMSKLEARRLEEHLTGCGDCRARLSRIEGGHRLAEQLPRVAPRRDPWRRIEAAIEGDRFRARLPAKSRLDAWLRPAFVAVVIALGIAVVLLITNGRFSRQESGNLMAADSLELGEFHPTNIRDFESASQPHVMAEGFVSEVRVNDEDGDLSFKLVENLHTPGPFIVCEIIDPIRLSPPAVGSRVRVYGVSRYDGQADHNWYEVHPVLNIQEVRR